LYHEDEQNNRITGSVFENRRMKWLFFSAPTALSARNKLQILNIHFSWDAKASRHSKEGFLFLDCLILMMEEKYSVEKSKNFKLIYLVDKSKFKGTAKPNTR